MYLSYFIIYFTRNIIFNCKPLHLHNLYLRYYKICIYLKRYIFFPIEVILKTIKNILHSNAMNVHIF